MPATTQLEGINFHVYTQTVNTYIILDSVDVFDTFLAPSWAHWTFIVLVVVVVVTIVVCISFVVASFSKSMTSMISRDADFILTERKRVGLVSGQQYKGGG